MRLGTRFSYKRALPAGNITLIMIFSSSYCTDYFVYYPSKQLYLHPRELQLNYREGYIYGADKNRIYFWYFPTQHSQPLATVVQFHGNAQNMTSHYTSLIWLLKHGYNFFTFDYRGYGKSEEKAGSKGIIADAKIVIKWLQKKSTQQKVPLLLYGQSLGGVILAHALGNLTDHKNIAAVILEGSFSSFKAVGKSTLNRGLFPPLGYISYLLMSDRYGSRKALPRLTPLPVIVIHGDQDQVIPLCFGEELYSLAQEPKKFLLIPGGGHIINWLRSNLHKERRQFLNLLQDYLQDYRGQDRWQADLSFPDTFPDRPNR